MRRRTFESLSAFATIVERGSFVRAAAHLGVTPSALSQTIRGLEEELGVRLLHRTTRRLAPTAAGEKLLARLAPTLRELDAAVARPPPTGQTVSLQDASASARRRPPP